MSACGYCGHVHAIETRGPEGDVEGALYLTCSCGCTQEGRRYEIGPSILDSPMLEVVPVSVRLGDAANGATFSDDMAYRYHLWRKWGRGVSMVWIMLNPSTADAEVDDMTITKCIGFARRVGCVGIEVLNLYALRATDPMVLRDVEDPEGEENGATWAHVLKAFYGHPVVAAWGGSFPRSLRVSKAYAAADPTLWVCLGHTTEGHPRHPSRIAYATQLVPFERSAW